MSSDKLLNNLDQKKQIKIKDLNIIFFKHEIKICEFLQVTRQVILAYCYSATAGARELQNNSNFVETPLQFHNIG